MRFKVIKNAWLPFGTGLTLYPFVFLDSTSERTFKHELMHCYQIRRFGVLRFYWKILKEYLRHGTSDGPLERECEDYERLPLTPTERWWYTRGVIDLE